MTKRFPVTVKRDVTYNETVELTIVAETADQAAEFASTFCGGGPLTWPTVDRYAIVNQSPRDYELTEVAVND